MPLAKHDDMIKTFASDRVDQPLRMPIPPRRSWRGRSVTNLVFFSMSAIRPRFARVHVPSLRIMPSPHLQPFSNGLQKQPSSSFQRARKYPPDDRVLCTDGCFYGKGVSRVASRFLVRYN